MGEAGAVTGRHKLEWLEVMRGFAACWVVLHHASNAVEFFVAPLPHATAARNGLLGVDFFFVLSGFIIALSSAQLVARGRGLREYLRARFLRIYVPYWPVGVPLLILYMAFPSLSAAVRDMGVFTSLTLLPSNTPPALSVAWTLVHEVVFYGVFATYFVSRRLHVATLVAWVSVILFWWWKGFEAGIGLTFLVSPRNLSFIVGLLVFHVRRLADQRAFALGDVPAAVVGTALVAWVSVAADHLLATVGFALVVFAAASRLAQARVPPRVLMTLGSASYAIYLVHNPLLSVLVRVAKRVSSEPWLVLSVISLFAIIAGVLYWRVIETPLLRWVRARFVAE